MMLNNNLGNNYFTLYPKTAIYFNQLSDLTVATTGIFSSRVLAYSINANSYQFMKGTNGSEYLNIFLEHIENIGNFLKMQS